MCLALLIHLDPVLEQAEESVGLGEFEAVALGQVAAQGDALQRRHGAGDGDIGFTPTEDELKGLREELDLADAAAAEFEVEATLGAARGATEEAGVDGPLGGGDLLDDALVDDLGEDEGAEALQEALA